MNATEKEVIRNVLRRLRCEPRASGEYGESETVRLALTGSVDPREILTEEEFTLAQRETFGLSGSRGEPATPYAGAVRVGNAARNYLDTWVIGALASLLDEEDGGTGRDLKLARDLSK